MSASEADHHAGLQVLLPDLSGAVSTSTEARAKCHIAALEEELQTMKEERGTKQRFITYHLGCSMLIAFDPQRKTTYYIAQGRAICRMVVLYTSLDDLIAENDRRYEDNPEDSTTEQDCLQRGYIVLAQVLPWLHAKLGQLDIDESQDMLKKLKRGADAARDDDTSTLKDLVASWVNQDFWTSSLLKSDDKQLRGFVHDACGKLLCPSEWDWGDDKVKASIRDRTADYIISENSWPLFLYEKYAVDQGNLERGLFKSKLLVQAFKATFTSPSSAREADGDGDGADILENNRRAQWQLNQAKVKPCMASIINMRKVTHWSITYVVCQVHFALSNISSWRTVDGDFDYEAFWSNVVDFFEDLPGPVAQCRVTNFLNGGPGIECLVAYITRDF